MKMEERKRIRISAPQISDEEIRGVKEVLMSGQLAQGKMVSEFEREFSAYTGCKHAIAVSNGTCALHLANLACSGKGRYAITTPFTFIATVNTILFAQRRPVFADVLEDGNIDPSCVRKCMKKSADLVIPVHLYGNPCEIKEICEIAADSGARVVEDAAQAHGARVDGRHVGTFGDAGIFSFYPTKNMTTGEGGMVVTNNDEIAEGVRLLRNHGQIRRYEYTGIGFNMRMTEINAAIGLVQLKKLDNWNEIRRRNARLLIESLEGIEYIKLPEVTDGHVFHQFTIRVLHGQRDRLADYLNKKGVDTAVHYPKVVYTAPHLRMYAARCPIAESLAAEVLSLPVHPGVSEEDIAYISECIRNFKP